jgi:SRSO17 transposase
MKTAAEPMEKALCVRMNLLIEDRVIQHEGLAMIILRQPRIVQAFFRPFRSWLSKPQFAHLWAMVLAMIVNTRRSKLLHLAAVVPQQAHRTAHGVFLARSDWDAQRLLDEQVGRTLRLMRPQSGEIIYLIIDDIRIPKRGRKMAAVSKIWDHKQQRFVHGHIVVTGAVQFRGVTLPWRFELWKSKGHAGRFYRKTTQIAAELIRTFRPPKGLKIRVLFDAFYLCPLVTHACQDRGFTWFSVASSNRCLTRDRGGRRRIRDLAPGLIKHQGHRVRLRRSRGWRWMRIASADGRLARIGLIRLVCSKRPRDPWKNMTAIATNEIRLEARTIVATYERRWAIEVLFKELRGELGLGDYQVLQEEAILKHLHLCGLAHLMLTHRSLQALGAQARKINTEPTLPTLTERRETLRAEIQRDQVRQLMGGKQHRRLRKKLEQYLFAA